MNDELGFVLAMIVGALFGAVTMYLALTLPWTAVIN